MKIFGINFFNKKTKEEIIEEKQYNDWVKKNKEKSRRKLCKKNQLLNIDLLLNPLKNHRDLKYLKICHIFMGKKYCYWDH